MSGFGEDWDAQKMLDLYIYDYMKRKNLAGAAEIFAQEADVRDVPPVAEGFLTDWWSIFWDTYCSRMRMKSGTMGESSSSVQPNNVMENAHQVIHEEVPMPLPDVNHQPAPQVPVGADLDPMMMGQQAPMQMPGVNHQPGPQVPVGADLDTMMMGQQAPMQMSDVNHQLAPQVPVGADFGAMLMGKQAPMQMPIVNHQPGPQVPAGADLDTMMMGQQPNPFLRANQLALARAQANAQVQAQAIAEAHAREAQAQARARASSSNASSQQLQALMMAAQTQQQVPPNGNRQGASLGRSMAPGAARYGASQRVNQQNSDEAGKNKGIMPQSPSGVPSISAFGNSSNSTGNQILNSFSAGSPQQNPFALNQLPESSISSALINPLNGSTSNAQTVVIGKENSSGQDGQAFGNSPNSTVNQILNSFSGGSRPQNPFAINQKGASSNSSARIPAAIIQGSAGSAQNVMLGNQDSSGEVGQGKFNHLDLNQNLKRGRDIQMNVDKTPTAKNQVVVPGQQGPKQPIRRTQTRNQPKKVQRKKKSSSTAVDKDNSLVDIVIELDKEDEVDTFLSHPDAADDGMGNSFSTLQISSSANSNECQGFSFKELSCFRLSNTKVLCCNFSSDGKYLASAGHEKKVSICNMDSLSHEVTAEGHANIITDVRFRAVSTIFATSSFDKTVQLWNAPRSKSLLTLHGHLEHVMSIDFHPQKYDFLSSCDSDNEIRLWDANKNACISVFKGASRQVRFQPQTGNLLAAASGKSVSLIDIDTKMPVFKFEGHANNIRSICWDPTGKYIASVSEDSARIWSSVGGGKCVYELLSNGNKFESCVFHPGHSQLLVIGSYQIIDLWNPLKGNTPTTIEAHEGIISSLAESPLTELIASASHDQNVKVWK